MATGKPFTQLVYDGLNNDIINGVITTNDILSESSLCERFGVSKSPVREALVMLCNENILLSIPRTGYKLVHIQPYEVQELIELRESIEIYLLNKSLGQINEEELNMLKNVQDEIEKDEKATDTPQAHWKRNERFHLALASIAKNSLMLDQLRQALNKCGRVSTQYFSGRRQEKPHKNLHPSLLHALETKNEILAREILSRDIREII